MRTTLGALAAALLPLTLAAPAFAGSVTVDDHVGDVLEGRVNQDGGFVVQSDLREGDVIRTTFRHGPRNVVVTSVFRALDPVGEYHGYYLRLQTGRRLYREVDVEAAPGLWRGQLTMTDRAGKKVRCRARHTIDYTSNTVRVVVPRSCLGRPGRVRGTAANAWTRPDAQDGTQPDLVAIDNPHDTTADTEAWTRWIRRG